MQKDYRALEKFLSERNIDYVSDYPFGKFSRLGAGGSVDLHIIVKNIDAFLNLLHFLKGNETNYFVVRERNKFLIADEGYRGALISLEGEFEAFEFVGDDILKANGSATLDRLSHESRIRNLSGLEFVALVDSRIGSAVYSGLESFGISLTNIALSVKVLNINDLSIKELNRDEFVSLSREEKDALIIISAALKLEKDSPESIDNRIDWFRYVRGSIAPFEANIGPVFEDCGDVKAYEMVERVGGLDMRAGSMRWYKRFPNYIVNDFKCGEGSEQSCKVSDVMALIEDTRKKIFQHYDLNPKVNITLLK